MLGWLPVLHRQGSSSAQLCYLRPGSTVLNINVLALCMLEWCFSCLA